MLIPESTGYRFIPKRSGARPILNFSASFRPSKRSAWWSLHHGHERQLLSFNHSPRRVPGLVAWKMFRQEARNCRATRHETMTAWALWLRAAEAIRPRLTRERAIAELNIQVGSDVFRIRTRVENTYTRDSPCYATRTKISFACLRRSQGSDAARCADRPGCAPPHVAYVEMGIDCRGDSTPVTITVPLPRLYDLRSPGEPRAIPLKSERSTCGGVGLSALQRQEDLAPMLAEYAGAGAAARSSVRCAIRGTLT
jgi:hypothetical protein